MKKVTLKLRQNTIQRLKKLSELSNTTTSEIVNGFISELSKEKLRSQEKENLSQFSLFVDETKYTKLKAKAKLNNYTLNELIEKKLLELNI